MNEHLHSEALPLEAAASNPADGRQTLKDRLKKHFSSSAKAAAAVAGMAAAGGLSAAVVSWVPPGGILIPVTTSGVYINVETQISNAASSAVSGWDINPWATTSLSFFNPAAPTPAYMQLTGGTGVSNLPFGTTVGPASTWSSGAAPTTGIGAWTVSSTNNYFGFRFNGADGFTRYGYARVEILATMTTAGRRVLEVYYESTPGVAITIPGPPAISYTPLGNTATLGNRTLSATISDPDGVPTAGIGLPRLFWRINALPYTAVTGTHMGGTQYDFTFGAGAVGGDVVSYYVVAQDNGGATTAFPLAGTGGYTANPPTSATPPTTPSSYTIASLISGTFNVGTAETFTSLTNNTPQGIFNYINNNVVAGNITIQVTSDLTSETGAVALNTFDSPWTITIKPSGAPRTISGAVASNALIRTNAASRVTIDGSTSGGTDRSLTISNTSTTTPQVVRFSSIGVTPITNNTLKNCIILNGINSSSAVVITDNGGAAAYFNNITIQNNDIRRAYIGVFANAALLAGNGSGTVYTQNTLNNTGTNAIRLVGLYMQGVDGGTISDNTIGNFESATGEGKTGIWLATGTVNTTVSGNSVSTIGHTAAASTNPVVGIRDSGGAVSSGNSISGNTISTIAANFGASAAVAGINCSSGGTIIQRNNISGVNNTSTGTWPAVGIDLSVGNGIVVRNNFISNVTGNMSGGAAFSSDFGISGIRVRSGSNHVIVNNSVNLFGARAGTATTSNLTAALSVTSTASTGLDIRNNILANNITGGNSPTANVSVFLPSGGSAAMTLTNNRNAYYHGTGALAGVGQQGTTASTPNLGTLALLTGYTSTLGSATNDNASTASSGAVPFASSSDLHITTAAPEWATGVAIGSVTNDFDGDSRPQGLSYDKGADEVLYACPPAASAGGPQTICELGTTAGLGGSDPSPGSGAWSIVGPGTGNFIPNNTTANATFQHLTGTGSITLRWTVTRTDCTPTTADVVVTLDVPSVWYADTDGDGLGAGASTGTACTPPNAGDVTNNTDPCPLLANAEPGDACDAGPSFVLGELDGSCNCVGVACTTDLDFVYQADGADQLTFRIYTDTDILVQTGGGFLSGDGSEATCLPDGCFYLVVEDGGSDGIVSGGYKLQINSAQRLIDNSYDAFGNGGFTSGQYSQIAGNEGFCLPVGTDRLVFTSCDKIDWKVNPCGGEYVVANGNPLVTAQYGFTNTTSGYQMWWYNPNGGYSFKRIQYHSTANGLTASSTRACHFKLNSWSGNQLQQGVVYNVKVRGIVNTAFQPWGPACRLMVDDAAAQCPRTQLNNIPGDANFSCGATRAIATNVYVHARPARRMTNACAWQNANRYQFRFRIPAESFLLVKTANTYFVNTTGLTCGKTYEMEVRVSFDGGATWCHGDPNPNVTSPKWGTVCLLNTVSCVNGGGNQNMVSDGTGLRMYPNPNRGDQLMLSLDAVAEGVSTVSVDIMDAFGKRVSARTIAVNDGFINTVLELNGELAAGMYLVNITAGEQVYTERLVIQP